MIPDEYSGNGEKCIFMLTQFESMWNGHLASIKARQHRIELDCRPIHSAPHDAERKAIEFEKQKIDQMLEMDVFEPPRHNGHLQAVFLKGGGTLHSSADFPKLNAVKIQD